MIRVQRQPEPPDFETTVRAKGRQLNPPPPPVPGSFWKNKEHWRNAIGDLHQSHGRVCAYTGFHLGRYTAAHSVDHFRPKCRYPSLAYEWDNFRLACAQVNSNKQDFEDVLDPFEIPKDTFDLNCFSGEILVHRNCPESLKAQAVQTIHRLKLNDGECLLRRREDISKLLATPSKLEPHESPFVHHCIQGQRLLPATQPLTQP